MLSAAYSTRSASVCAANSEGLALYQLVAGDSVTFLLLLSELEVMFGIVRCHTYCSALNHIILEKYFLFVNALNNITYQFDDFVSLVREKINLEKYIAVTSNKEKDFRNKWKFFRLYKISLCTFSTA